MAEPINLSKYARLIQSQESIKTVGRVTQVVGLVIESEGPPVAVGDTCVVLRKRRGALRVEAVGFKEKKVLLMPLGDMDGVSPGCEVIADQKSFSIRVGRELQGRIFDGLGMPLDEKGHVFSQIEYPIQAPPPDPLKRSRITLPLSLGVRSIDGLLTCGKGQRLGIFAGSGVGKSLLLGMIARNTTADVNVIALVGERGREVRDFIDRDLGVEGLKRSVVIVATSDQPALVRVKAALVAHAFAEYFRDEGMDVLLMMDSVTRLCFAQREVGLAVGEPPATKGYTPSVYAMLPRILERSGNSDKGSITGLYTVLVEGDDMSDPVADQVRSILDGHIVLSRELAERGQYPAVDVLGSISRVMMDIVPREHTQAAGKLRETLAVYKDAQDLINIGAYADGSNPKIDFAKSMVSHINEFLKQDMNEKAPYEKTVEHLRGMFP